MSNDKLSDIQDYEEQLCIKHKQLLHSDTNRVFARFQTQEHITEIQHQGSEKIVVIAEVNGRRVGGLDSREIRRGIGIMFAVNASRNGNAGDAITAAIETSEDIMLDFLVKMEEDQRNGCGLEFDLANASWEEIEGPWLENYYGWLLFLPFKGYLPEFDADKWNE